MKKLSVLMGLAFFLSGCISYTYTEVSSELKIALDVHDYRNAELKDTKGSIYNESNNSYRFEDDNISISIYVGKKTIHFDLKNISKQDMVLIWDDMLYKDLSGYAHRCLSGHISYSERNNPIVKTLIPKDWSIKDFIVPFGGIVNSSTVSDIFPTCHDEQTAKQYIGKSVMLYFPLEIGGEKKIYLFDFKIVEYNIIKEQHKNLENHYSKKNVLSSLFLC